MQEDDKNDELKNSPEMAHTQLESRSNATFMDYEFGQAVNAKQTFSTGMVFLIMPMKHDGSDVAFKVFRTECIRLGLSPVRADDLSDSGIILKDIFEMIEKAEFIICDLSSERPNVYYELGYAHGVGNQSNRILLTASADSNLHFDIAPLRVHFYKDANELRRLMRTRFKQMVRNVREVAI